MKKLEFKLRMDQDLAGNIRRLRAHIRRIDPAYKPVPSMLARANYRAVLKLVK